MLTFQGLACIESQKIHKELCHSNPDILEKIRYNAKPVCVVQCNCREIRIMQTLNSQNRKEFQPTKKKFLHSNELRRAATSFLTIIEQFLFIKNDSVNSVFNLQLVKTIKSNVSSCQILTVREKLISTKLRPWARWLVRYKLLPEKGNFLTNDYQCPTLFRKLNVFPT